MTLLHSTVLEGTLNGPETVVQHNSTASHVCCHIVQKGNMFDFFFRCDYYYMQLYWVKAQLSCDNVSASFYMRLRCG